MYEKNQKYLQLKILIIWLYSFTISHYQHLIQIFYSKITFVNSEFFLYRKNSMGGNWNNQNNDFRDFFSTNIKNDNKITINTCLKAINFLHTIQIYSVK